MDTLHKGDDDDDDDDNDDDDNNNNNNNGLQCGKNRRCILQYVFVSVVTV